MCPSAWASCLAHTVPNWRRDFRSVVSIRIIRLACLVPMAIKETPNGFRSGLRSVSQRNRPMVAAHLKGIELRFRRISGCQPMSQLDRLAEILSFAPFECEAFHPQVHDRVRTQTGTPAIAVLHVAIPECRLVVPGVHGQHGNAILQDRDRTAVSNHVLFRFS